MKSSAGTFATVRSGSEIIVNQDVRRTKATRISRDCRSLINLRLKELQPEIERHFRIELSGYESPQFLMYSQGGFYTCHQDSTIDTEAPDYFKARKISIVIFINNESYANDQDSYGGGHLTFYGLMSSPPWDKCGLPFISDEGLLVAFRSEILHEVTMVTHGNRYTIVTWYC